MTLTETVKQAVLDHAKEQHPRECCGLVVIHKGKQRYVPCKNIADGNNHFAIDPNDYVAAEELGEIFAVVHSHPDIPAAPSQADLVSCEASGLPWFIVSHPLTAWSETYPTGYKAPLVGREWKHGVLDCYALIRDWYSEEMGLQLPNFSREDDWWNKGQNLYLDSFADCGFIEISQSELKRGDALLMAINAPVPCHAAIYLGDGMILHHMNGRLSCREALTGSYLSRTTHFLRYNRSL